MDGFHSARVYILRGALRDMPFAMAPVATDEEKTSGGVRVDGAAAHARADQLRGMFLFLPLAEASGTWTASFAYCRQTRRRLRVSLVMGGRWGDAVSQR